MMRSIRSAAVLALLVLLPVRAHATFHVSSITEVMSGFNGDPSVEYVETREDFAGQNAIANTRLTAFNADGTVATVLILTPTGVANFNANRRILYATASFATLSGITPDFLIPSGVISTPSGMICWGAPYMILVPPPTWDETIPNNYIDCIAYGSYTGPTRGALPTLGSSGTPSSLPPGNDTLALTRIGGSAMLVGSNSTDFALQTPGPCTNGAQSCNQLGCSNPGGNCAVLGSGCGNGNKDAGEVCDDGNLVNGDGCQSDCTLTPSATQVTCRDGIVKAVSGFAKSYTKALAGCGAAVLKGKPIGPCPDVKAAAKIAKAESKKDAAIAKACPGQTPADAGFGATCPGLEGTCTSALATLPDVVDCVDCVFENGGTQLERALYGTFTAMSPALKCQLAIGKAVNGLYQAKTKVLAKCEDQVLRGKIPGPCPDVVATGKISVAVAKETTNICKACGGADKLCDGSGDAAPVDVGITTCLAVHDPAGANCGAITITTLADLASCVDCIAQFKADCSLQAAVHPLTLPPECSATNCGDGVRNGTETDVDCGGGTCPACAAGAACGVGSDCLSTVCSGSVCQP